MMVYGAYRDDTVIILRCLLKERAVTRRSKLDVGLIDAPYILLFGAL